MKNKKAQTIAGLPSNIIALVVAIIILVLGIVIIQEIRDADMVQTAESASFVNETLTTVTETGETLACGSNPAGACATVGTVTNTSSGTVIPTTNFTQTNCVLVYSGGAGDSGGFNNSNWNVTYGCTYGGVSYTSANESLVAVGNFSDFIPIIVIALAAAIVIGLIIGGFAMRRRER
jgi:hypothetical protein